MDSFVTYKSARRETAIPLKPVVDPAGWTPEDLSDIDRAAYHFTESDKTEIAGAIAAARRAGVSMTNISVDEFPLGRLANTLADVRRELLDGRGIVLLRGFPVDRLSQEDAALGYVGLGSHLGSAIPQNKHGHMLGHVRDLSDPKVGENDRLYGTTEELTFHTDSADFVGLLCLHGAKKGGESRVASSVTIYNRILKERPELAEALMQEFCRTRYGEINPGELPYYKWEIFAFVDGYFCGNGCARAIDKAQGMPGVPPLTDVQREAMRYYREIVLDCAASMTLQAGDIQFLNNYVVVHARYAYEDWPEPHRKRHLLRLWLNDKVGRPIPQGMLELRNAGVRMKGVDLTAPIAV